MKPISPKSFISYPHVNQEEKKTPESHSIKQKRTGTEDGRTKHSPGVFCRYRSRSTTRLSQRTRKNEARFKLRRSVSEARIRTDNELPASNELYEVEKHRITVGVRIRPFHSEEDGNATGYLSIQGNEVKVASTFGSHSFFLDHVFGPKTSQEHVYNTMVRTLLDNAFQGYNCCLFTYGQTGSGKTYSMLGSEVEVDGISDNTGIIPRFCQELMDRVNGVINEPGGDTIRPTRSSVEVSYLEIYNEKIRDLLVPLSSQNLKVREHPSCGPYVASLSKHVVLTFSDLKHIITQGNKQKVVASTEMNEKSSRSHSLFMVNLTQYYNQISRDDMWKCEQSRRSQINLVDLAGNERIITHVASTSDRLKERVFINCSLMTLGKVISALIEKKPFVPYRESVLTWLLKESLSGNSRTVMLATVSPCSTHQDETIATLRYAAQARTILNTVHINEASQATILKELRLEGRKWFKSQADTDRLRSGAKQPVKKKSCDEVIFLKAEIRTMQQLVDELKGKLAESENTKKALKEREAQMERESFELNKSKECFDNWKKKFENFVSEHETFFKMCLEKDRTMEILRNRTQRAKTKKSDAHDKLVASEKEVNRLSDTIQKLLQEKAHLADKLQVMEKSVVEWKSDLEMRMRIEEGLRIRAESAEREIKMWHEKVAASIPEALQRITDTGSIDEDIEAYKTKIKDIKREAKSLSEALEEERTQKNFWKRELEICNIRLQTAENQLAHAEEELKVCKSKLEEKEIEMEEWVISNEETVLRKLGGRKCDLDPMKNDPGNI